MGGPCKENDGQKESDANRKGSRSMRFRNRGNLVEDLWGESYPWGGRD